MVPICQNKSKCIRDQLGLLIRECRMHNNIEILVFVIMEVLCLPTPPLNPITHGGGGPKDPDCL